MITTAHAAEIPKEIQYSARPDGMADVWMRKNIVQAPYLSDDENLSGGMEYVYDEVFLGQKIHKGKLKLILIPIGRKDKLGCLIFL